MASDRSGTRALVGALRSPLPWVALALALAVTFLGWMALWRDSSQDASRQFERGAQSAEAAVRVRLRAYEQMLVAGAALFTASRDVTRGQWAEFVARLKLDQRYPGIQAMGFAERVRRADRDRHVARVRAEGLADYDIRPPGERDDYVPIVYSEPYKGRNVRVVGLDTYSQPVLYAALVRAFETGEAAVTEKVVLPGEDASGAERTQPGFVMYLPVFRAGMPVATKEQRDAALLGFVFSTFRMNEFSAGMLDSGLAQSVDVTLYDGAAAAPEAMYVDTREGGTGVARTTPLFQRQVALDVGGRKWTAVFASHPGIEARAQDAIPFGLLAGGFATTLAIFALALMLAAARRGRIDTTTRDELTQLYNSHYLEETMARELPRAKRAGQSVGLVLMDLDGFKAIHDKLGKECGEQVLKQFALLLEKNTRESDIKCRFGGSQFALGMPGASIENARTRAERLREVLEQAALECGGKAVGPVTLSSGIAAYPQHGEDWSGIVQRAHRALYAAKSEGGNRVSEAS
jgi:diguanylate cyclase (GGDEF)-like protein